MTRNLPLIFGLVLGGALLVEHGAKAFAGTLSTPAAQASTGPADAGRVGLSGAIDAIGSITPGMLLGEASKYGWSASEVSDWRSVISQESGGNERARNPSSGAFGVGQFLGDTLREYTPYGAASSSAGPQLNAMGRYIHDRYRTPSAALAHERQFGWY